METLIESIIGLATQVLTMINNNEALKYVDQLKQARMDLLAEKAKGYESDDAKIETLQSQIGILLQAVQGQLQLFNKAPAPATPPPVV